MVKLEIQQKSLCPIVYCENAEWVWAASRARLSSYSEYRKKSSPWERRGPSHQVLHKGESGCKQKSSNSGYSSLRVPQEAVLRLEYYCGEPAVISEFNNMKLNLES